MKYIENKYFCFPTDFGRKISTKNNIIHCPIHESIMPPQRTKYMIQTIPIRTEDCNHMERITATVVIKLKAPPFVIELNG